MWVHSLTLTDFRSHGQVNLDLSPGVTTFVGLNGQGKTNLVEAIGYVSSLASHRVASDAPLVRHGAEIAFIRCGITSDDREITVDIAITPGRANKARVNQSPLPRIRDVLGLLRTVLFAPEDLSLVKGDPSERRRFLDDLLIQRSPRLAATRSDYERVLKQRNALLKSASVTRRRAEDEMLRTLEVWDDQLATIGGQLVHERVCLVADLQPLTGHEYQIVAGAEGSALGLAYVSSLGDSGEQPSDKDAWRTRILEELVNRRGDELNRGLTLVGPHRDDLLLMLANLPAKGYASHGEAWSIALALRLASFALLRQDGVDPVLMLDDVFAELDATRRERLAQRVSSAQQVLITAAVEADVPSALHGATFRVSRESVALG
ncbi:MAG: DNA replication/repair protein RecF [Candidatus Nanopelagicales bacterium]